MEADVAQRIDPLITGSTTMGAEILARDWSDTSLGAPSTWPMSLRAIVAMMLGCPTPMFLAWGPDLRLLYNDAYRPMLGARVDRALGERFQDTWADVWTDVVSLVEAALDGRGVALRDLPLTMTRNGAPEQTWWTFSYSPLYGDDDVVGGLFCTVVETTERVKADRDRAIVDERLQLALSAGRSIGTWDWDVVAEKITADARFATLYGVDPQRAAAGATLAEFFSRLHPDDTPRVREKVEEALRTGAPFSEEYRLIEPDGQVRWVVAQGRCTLDAQGRPLRFPGVSFDISERKETEEALRASEERFRAITNSVEQMIWSTRPDGFHDYYNDRWYAYTGVPPGSTDGDAWSGLFHSDDQERMWATWRRSLETGEPYHIEYRLRHRSGEYRWVLGRAQPVRDAAGQVTRWFGTCTDIQEIVDAREVLARSREELERAVEARTAELMAAEDQLRQSLKMEALGQLTGGIAHDFNNMLAIVIGGLNLIERRLSRGDTNIARYVDSAMEGATRAASLTQRLLAFSRQQPLAPEAIEGRAMLAGLHELLTRTIGEQIQLETIVGPDLWPIRADANQLENVIINLAVNARDAMPDGGRLTIETANAPLDTACAREAGVRAGDYVIVAVTDTGAGMSPEVMARIFDPFFTTKGVGKGTGLGLSQTFGFARQSGGFVKVRSTLGEGSVFELYLPRFEGEAAPAPKRAPAGAARGGSPTEIILVVEDEGRVRNFSVEALRELGYTVLHAGGGAEALAMLEAGQDIKLLFTDVVMPEMNGRELADRALKKSPNLKIIFTTGYTRDAVVRDGVVDPGANLLIKPFDIDQLAAKMRSVLDAA